MTPFNNPYPRPVPTPEEQADFEARLEAAKAVRRAHAIEEAGMDCSAGWRPWMGPRKEPPPEEVAAHEAATAAWREQAIATLLEEPDFPGGLIAGPVPHTPAPPTDRNGTPSANGHPAPAAVSPSPSGPA